MQQKTFYIIFISIVIVGVAIIFLFARSLVDTTEPVSIVKKNNLKNDVLISKAPDVKVVTRIPTLERKDPIVGKSDGEITIIEFADFECQYCAEAQATLDEVMKLYPDKIRVIWKNYPLTFHAHSQKAAEAVLCANEQKKFEPMKKILYEKQNVSLLERDIRNYAEEIKLDMVKFNTCFDGGLNQEAVQRDVATALQYNLEWVPSFYVYKTNDTNNGYLIDWAPKLSEIKAVIEAVLK